MTKKLLAFGLGALTVAAISGSAFAHGSMKPLHGGMVQMNGETVIELVSSPKGVDVYLTEEDEPVSAANYTAKLTQTVGAAKTEAKLVPVGGNKLSAAGFKPAKGAKLVVALADKSGAKIFASFQAN